MLRNLPLIFLLLTLALLTGCAPTIAYRIDTQVFPDESCVRKVVVKGVANKRVSNQQVKLQDYLDLPEAEKYEHFVLTPNQLILGGRFSSPTNIPPDFVKRTPHTEALAENAILFRHIDLVLVDVMDYEEQVKDILARPEAEDAFNELVRLVLGEFINALHDMYDEKYDITGLELYLREEFPKLANRLYARLWELRRARRGGIQFVDERTEWQEVICHEAQRYGVTLVPGLGKEAEKINRNALSAFLNQKLEQLTKPLQEDVPPLNGDFLKSKEEREEFLAALQNSVKAQYGTVHIFLAKLEPLLPKAFGAFLINQYSLLPTNPHFDFQVRLDLPGTVVQTNGLLDLDGKLLWSFSEKDMGLTGYRMWARSLVPNEGALGALGLEKFPGHLNSVEQYFRLMHLGGNPSLRKLLQELLKQSIQAGSLGPLQQSANVAAHTEESAERQKAAQDLFAFLSRFLPGADVPERSETAGRVQPEVDEVVTGGLSAPGQETTVRKDRPAPENPPVREEETAE